MSNNSGRLTYLFSTWESDAEAIYKDADGNFFSRRYGLPILPISKERAESVAWFQINREGGFLHLRYFKPGETIPSLSNPEAQKFLVSLRLRTASVQVKPVF